MEIIIIVLLVLGATLALKGRTKTHMGELDLLKLKQTAAPLVLSYDVGTFNLQSLLNAVGRNDRWELTIQSRYARQKRNAVAQRLCRLADNMLASSKDDNVELYQLCKREYEIFLKAHSANLYHASYRR